jgi:ABC-type glycerol-3-phosphate transport system permease component
VTDRSTTAARAATALLVAALLLPVAWAVLASFMPERALFGGTMPAPAGLGLDHYRALFAQRDFWTPLFNSLVVAASTTLMALLLGAPCAYAVARVTFRGRTAVLGFVLAVSMFPQIAMVPSLYLMLRSLHLLNTWSGLVLPYLTFALPLAVWLLAGFFRQLPRDLEDAAFIDGAGWIRTVREVVLPLSWPGVATTGVLVFLSCWNEFLFALSFTLGPERYTVPVAITLFRGQYQVPWGQVLAAAVIATAVVAALVLVAQRRIVAGLTSGAIKG